MPATRPPITDSPWFWLYLFSTFGVILLAVAGPKYQARQHQIEQKTLSRQRAWEVRNGQTPTTQLANEGDVEFSLQPLVIILSVALAIGWIVLWWQRMRQPSQTVEATRSPPSAA